MTNHHSTQPSPITKSATAAGTIGVMLSCLVGGTAADSPEPSISTVIQTTIVPLLAQHCLECHSGAEPKANFSLDAADQKIPITQHYVTWEKVLRRIISGEMPPPGQPPLSSAEHQLLKTTIMNMMSNANGFHDPGRVTIRRLNRTEYTNTIRDLFGIEFALPDDFPTDDVGYGFDHIGDVLSLSPLLLEKYLTTSHKIARAVIFTPESIQKPSALITTLNFNGGIVSGAPACGPRYA